MTRQIRPRRSEEHTSELQSRSDLVCRLLLEKKQKNPPPLPPSPAYITATHRAAGPGRAAGGAGVRAPGWNVVCGRVVAVVLFFFFKRRPPPEFPPLPPPAPFPT